MLLFNTFNDVEGIKLTCPAFGSGGTACAIIRCVQCGLNSEPFKARWLSTLKTPDFFGILILSVTQWNIHFFKPKMIYLFSRLQKKSGFAKSRKLSSGRATFSATRTTWRPRSWKIPTRTLELVDSTKPREERGKPLPVPGKSLQKKNWSYNYN